MIQRFEESDFKAQQDKTLEIAKEMQQGQSAAEQMYDRIRNAFKEGKLEICGYYDASEESLLGLVFLGHVSNIISWLHVDEEALGHNEATFSKIQRALIDEAITRLPSKESGIAAYGPYVTDNLSEILMSAGFTKYDRASMEISTARIESFATPNLPEGYLLESYNAE